MYTIRKEFAFSASHCLSHLPDTHPCSRVHGHNYIITVELRSENLDGNEFVKDYRELDEIKSFLDTKFDHRHLNDVMPVRPTAENIASYLYNLFSSKMPLSAIEVSETPKTSARYER